jgi:hypothetical protein
MSRTIRRIFLCVLLLAALAIRPTIVRADPPDQSDYNAVWQYAESGQQPNPNDGYNPYYQEVQDQQLANSGQ